MFFINPFIYAGGGDFESIATVTVGSGGASNIEFTSIPSTYQHLQIRAILMGTDGSDWRSAYIRVGNGSIDTGSNYAYHTLGGNGSSAFAGGAASQSFGLAGYATSSTNIPGPTLLDILDYGSTSKTKTLRCLTGSERNATPSELLLTSTLWNSTSAIDTIRLYPSGGSFRQYSTAALYGVKAP